MKTKNVALLITLAVLIVAGNFATSRACSVCLCGDDLYLYGHRHKLMPGKYSLSFENKYFNKSSGHAEPHSHPGHGEESREYRPTFSLAYGATNDITLAVNFSSSFKRLKEIDHDEVETINNSGFGDMQFEALFNRRLTENFKGSYLLGLLVSLKAPTGSSDKERDGERLDEHIQSGTGSWDFKTGIGISRITAGYSAFVSTFYQLNGTNDYEYHFGNSFHLNLGSELHTSEKFSVTGDLNGRYASRDEEDGEKLQNTGGWVFYIAPGLRYKVLPHLGIISNVQIPIVENLFEDQDEKPVFNLTFRYDLL